MMWWCPWQWLRTLSHIDAQKPIYGKKCLWEFGLAPYLWQEWLCWRWFEGSDNKSFIHSSSLLTGSDKIASSIWHHQIWIVKDCHALHFLCEQYCTKIIKKHYHPFIAQFWFCKLRIKRDKSVSKRLGCGQFCLRYFRQVLTQALLFQPSRRNCFSTNLSKCADCISTAPPCIWVYPQLCKWKKKIF